jgi:hypothetical protein
MFVAGLIRGVRRTGKSGRVGCDFAKFSVLSDAYTLAVQIVQLAWTLPIELSPIRGPFSSRPSMNNGVVLVVRRGDVVRKFLQDLVNEAQPSGGDRLVDLRAFSQSKSVAAVLLPLEESVADRSLNGSANGEPANRLAHANGEASPPGTPASRITLEARVDLVERTIIEECLARNQHRRKETAAELGISRVTLYNKMKKLGLQ